LVSVKLFSVFNKLGSVFKKRNALRKGMDFVTLKALKEQIVKNVIENPDYFKYLEYLNFKI